VERDIKIEPFENCPALAGCHCQTNSLAKIYRYYNCPLSEEMLLGLGCGMGFVYWHQKGAPPFVGGRGNVKGFFQDVGGRTGVRIDVKATASERKAQDALLEKLKKKQPVMLYGDMGYLPWFDLPEEYHFGGHTFVVCGYDGKQTVLASDMDQASGGLKKGFYHPVTLQRLNTARSSPYKPFPPKNRWLEFDFSGYRPPVEAAVLSAIRQTVASILSPPISNIGVKGMRRSAKEILRWRTLFSERELRMNLFNIYIFTEIGGTGGGCFRYMYSRFLKEAAGIVENLAHREGLDAAASRVNESGKMFTKLGLLYKDAETASDIDGRIEKGSEIFKNIAFIEEEAFGALSENVGT
jgi:hypothetical protein